MPATPRLHLLVIDDHPIAREGIVQLLQREWPDSEVSQAATLAQAHGVLAARPDVALVLLDVHLPGTEPLQALRELRLAFPMLPVAMLSGDTDPVLAQQTLRLGAAGYLPKSADTALLAHALRLVLDGNCYVPPFLLNLQPPPAAAQALTPRQRDVLESLTRGLANKEIARQLELAEPTVKAHLVTIFRVLNVKNRTQAVLAGRQLLQSLAPRQG
ncbi:response regulator transcription factor [Aquincola sp. S2]|uniref:Response regulator transcription factor n=1 Tax=Pseudaquabacterium terrae TaxID=2732868 RepID=A0ABX2EA59_9BURK|nr:response regulator transcription factor [Aquabacterium terrae]NRF65388.1 response regulator transcription factor [Aquabacterium terrae]